MSWQEDINKHPSQSAWFQSRDHMIHAQHWQYDSSVMIILIHGAIANSYWWSHLASILGHGDVWAIDLSGHGKSDWHAPYSLQQHADEVTALINAYREDRPVMIVGHSYGGAVAALVQAEMDQINIHSVMLDTPIGLAVEKVDPRSRSYQKYVYPRVEDAIERFKPIPSQPIQNVELLQWIGRRSIKQTDGGVTWQFDPDFHQRIITPRDQAAIKTVIHEVSFWYGENSPFAQTKDLDIVWGLGMSMTMIPDAYHAVMLDAPQALRDQMIRLYQELLLK